MILALKIIIGILLAFTAIGLLCAVRIGRPRPPPADPFFYPFGEMPILPGVTATHPVAGSGASSIPPDAAAARVADRPVFNTDGAAAAARRISPARLTRLAREVERGRAV